VEAKKERTPRVDWAGLLRRTFALDGFACVTWGGRRQVAFVIEKDTTVFLEEQSPVPDLVGVSPFFLTVFAPDAPMNPKLGILQRSGPGCEEDDRSDVHVLDLWPWLPDGGVLDGGQG